MLCGRTRPTPVRLIRMRPRHYYQSCVSVRASPIHESTLTIGRLILILPDVVVQDFSQHVWVQFCDRFDLRSEEHTSELQSQFHLVCRLLLEKKKKKKKKKNNKKNK